MKLHTLALISTLALSAAAVQPALADTLYSQAPTLATAYYSNSGVDYLAYDNFTLGANGTVASVTWYGVYVSPPPAGSYFTINLFSTSSGAPGTLLSSTMVGDGSPTDTGMVLIDAIAVAHEVFSYSAAINPFSAAAGTEYWLNIVSNTGLWAWETGSGGDGMAFDDGTRVTGSEGFVPHDLAFTLSNSTTNTAVTPEPSSLTLFGSGALALVGMVRRRRPVKLRQGARKLSQSGAVLLVLLTVMFATAVPARADSLAACATGSVTSILGSSCTIGDKTFQFNTWSNSMNALPSDDVIFTPDASNPNSPGFTLSALFGRGTPHFSVFAGSSLVLYTEELDYGVSITNPGSGNVIVGATGTETGASVVWTDATPTTTLDALAYSYLRNGPSCFTGTLVGIYGSSGSVAFNKPSDTEDNFPSTTGCTNTTAAQGIAQIFLGAQGGVVSLTTAGYYVDEAAPSTVVPTPEPETLLLVGSGMLGLGMFHYRRRRTISDARNSPKQPIHPIQLPLRSPICPL